MSVKRIIFTCSVATLLICSWVHSQSQASGRAPAKAEAESVKAFLGRWDLTLKAPDREHPSWLELRGENGQLKSRIRGALGKRAAASEGRGIGRALDVCFAKRPQRAPLLRSFALDGTQGNADSLRPAISADGRYVVFISQAKLAPGVGGGVYLARH